MKTNSVEHHPQANEVSVYECEVHLKFRLIEENGVLCDRDPDHLLEALLDAYTYGEDSYLESMQVEVSTQLISEMMASPQMRRQLMRLRNMKDTI